MGTVNDSKSTSLSIVIPVYNEAAVIEGVIRGFYAAVVSARPGTQLIVAEDGSTDATRRILARLNRELPFTLITGPERKGYTQAFKDALAACRSELVLFSDSDGQHDPADVFRLLEALPGADIVGGYKRARHDPFHRVLVSRAYNLIISSLFGFRVRDIDAGFKLIRKRVIDEVLGDVTEMRYCVMSEFVIKARLAGFSFREIPVTHFPRKAGYSSIFTLRKLPGIALHLLSALIRIRLSRRGRPACA